jgi:hypothetical protein
MFITFGLPDLGEALKIKAYTIDFMILRQLPHSFIYFKHLFRNLLNSYTKLR